MINGNITIQADNVILEGFEINGGVDVYNYGGVTVAYNKVTNSAGNGIVYSHGAPSLSAPGTVTNNVVSTPGNLGIYIDHDGIHDFTVSNNTLINCRKSIGFGTLSGGVIEYNDIIGSTEMDVEIFYASKAHVNYNNFSGIVYNGGTADLDAENNWWGDFDPSDQVTGNVDYTPYAGGPFIGYINGSDYNGNGFADLDDFEHSPIIVENPDLQTNGDNYHTLKMGVQLDGPTTGSDYMGKKLGMDMTVTMGQGPIQ